MIAEAIRMCGIAGVVPLKAFSSDDAARILASLAPRGPDDQGWAVLGPAGTQHGREVPSGALWTAPVLLHRRLSILDLTDAAHQPMSSADGRVHIAYNGEVYNFRELRAELETLGHRFQSDGDTEVVLAAYREWGQAMLGRLVGMFAIAIVDMAQQKLFLARDHFGVKPLYFAAGSWGFAFASDIPTLLLVPGVTRLADPGRVQRYIGTSSGISSYGGDTLFSDVKQVPPAHFMELDLAAARPTKPTRYWNVADIKERRVPYDEAVAEVRRLFLDSVRIQLRSDVGVGAALSGGIDSSAIVSAVRHHIGPDKPIHSFSYIADDPKVSEEKWIRLVETQKGTLGHAVKPSVGSLAVDLPVLVRAQGEPFGSSSIYAQYCVFQSAAAAGVPVVLDGQGADELLAGYRGYYPALLAGLVRKGRLWRAFRLYRAMCGEPGVSTSTLRTEAIAFSLPGGVVRRLRDLRATRADSGPGWLDAAWFQGRADPASVPMSSGPDVLRHALVASVTETSLPHLLRYADRNSMAHSVESRVPFLDHRLASYILSLPDEYIVGSDATTKRVFRDAMRGLVPEEVLGRRDKIGFQTTEREWLMALDDWVCATLASETARSIPFLRPDRMLAEWAAIKAGTKSYSWTVWRWINLIEWTRLFNVIYDAQAPPQQAIVVAVASSEQVPAPVPHGQPTTPFGDGGIAAT